MPVRIETPEFQAPISTSYRDTMLADLLTPEEIKDGKAKAEERGWHTSYCTTGNAMVLVVYSRGGYISLYDCTVVRRQSFGPSESPLT